ncbi:MAG: GTP-binding protein, partial [Ruminococcus sp.]|nr:GTP-binding protein [Ruminococcus sp.]
MKRLVTGIFAHVDSGKTTLSEAILYNCGEIRSLGRVDHKNSFLDNHFIERDRGITVFSKQAVFRTADCEFTLLDTPGHIDFSAEAERTMQILDYAILVISASDGIQGHTETLWSMLRQYNVPVFIFVNKTDMNVRDKFSVLNELKTRLSSNCIDFSEDNSSDDFYDSLAVCDENLLEEMLSEEKISDEHICSAISERKVFP